MTALSSNPQDGDLSSQQIVARSTVGAALTAAAGLLGRAAGLLTTLVVTHFVSMAEYGNANLAMIIARVLNSLMLLSPQQALLTRREGQRQAAQVVHFYASWTGLLLGIAILLVRRPLLGALGQPEAAPLLGVYCVSLVLERLGVIPAVALRYRLRFGAVARLDLVGDVAYVAVTIGTAAAGMGGLCLPLGMVARHATRLVMLALLVGAEVWPGWPGWGPPERQYARETLRYSWPIHLGGLGQYVTQWADNVLVGKLYHAAAQGLYAVGFTLLMTPAETISLYGTTALVRALGVPEESTRRRAFLDGLCYLCLLLFPIAAGGALVARTLEQALLPARWQGVAPILVGLCGAGMFSGIPRLTFVHLTAIHRTHLAAIADVGRSLAFVAALCVVTICDPGRAHMVWIAWGVSASTVVAAALGLGLSLFADGMTLRQGVQALAPPLLGAVLMTAGLLPLQAGLSRLGLRSSLPRLLVEIAAGVAIYAGSLRLLHPRLYGHALGWLRARLRRG